MDGGRDMADTTGLALGDMKLGGAVCPTTPKKVLFVVTLG